MRVTAAIPCYNGGLYLRQSLASLARQTRPADEILVVDDGSTDDSAAIAREVGVRLVQHPGNRGLAAARNTALAHATGDVIVFVDADAVADGRLIEALLSGYDAPDVAGVGGQGIEANIQNAYDRWRALHATQGHGPRPLDRCEFLYGLCSSYRRGALEAVGGFDERYRTNGEDVDVGARLRAAGFRLVYRPEAVVHHQRRDDRASLERTIERWYYWAYVARRANRGRPGRMWLGVARSLIYDAAVDLLAQHSLALAVMDVVAARAKARAILASVRTHRESDL